MVRAERRGSDVHLRIEDNGPGADAETLARAMDPFFTAKGRPDATGLGLFISYTIISNHGGSMEISSAPSGGFRVDILLPLRGAGPAGFDADAPG